MSEPRHFGKYEVLEEVGQGGMSVVYRGRDTVLGREVAVKVMHPFMASRAESKERFYREARTVARLHHQNVLEIYDFSAEGAEQAYIVTEFIRGETLTALTQRVTITLPEIGLMIVRTVLEALEHAHEQGVIHRDLKPENVMIRAGGVVKLMDFGIAQMLDADTLTTTGALLGSPAHMAPELIEGEACDTRSDLFSIGTILYWLVTARLPFTAPTAPALFKKIVEANFDDPRVHNPQVSNGLLGILRKLMRKKRDERYASARDVITAIDQELSHSGIDQPGDTLKEFFKTPEATQTRLAATVSLRMKKLGDEALARSDVGEAMAAYDRRLSLTPDDHTLRLQVLSLGRKLRRREQWQRAARLVRLGIVMIGIWGGAIAAATYWLEDRPAPLPSFSAPAPLPTFHRELVPPSVRKPARTDTPRVEAPTGPALPPRDVEFRIFPFGTLSVDGQVLAQDVQKPVKFPLTPGKHKLRADNLFREPVEREFEVPKEGDMAPVSVRLDAFRPGRLVVHSDSGADALIDGDAKGPAAASEKEPFRIPLVQGERSVDVKVVKAGKPDKNEKVLIRAGQTVEVSLRW